ncbi:unnamed protein product [Caenorhabditis sp. 36 PRJEB53466]|nr:unnamed protein product [Caenorhabditis sp. 36 PRJEB53466]
MENPLEKYKKYKAIVCINSDSQNSDVYEGEVVETKVPVIMKRNRLPKVAIPEIEVHSQISHAHIVQFIDSFADMELREVIVMERCQFDLQQLIAKEPIPPARIQKFTKHMLLGLAYLHENNYIHRDIKPENLLIDDGDNLKLGDFGLARRVPSPRMTPHMMTLWFRPLEILLGSTTYTTSVDIWAVGCVLAEMYRRYSLFRSQGQIGMINQIINVFGVPDEEDWPDFNNLPEMQNIVLEGPEHSRIDDAVDNASEAALDLLEELMQLNPERTGYVEN